MNTKNHCDNGIKTPGYRQPCGLRGPEARRRFATKSLLAALLWAVVLIPAAANSQTLNDAVTEQLQVGLMAARVSMFCWMGRSAIRRMCCAEISRISVQVAEVVHTGGHHRAAAVPPPPDASGCRTRTPEGCPW